MAIWEADFETTTNPADCRVWFWAVVELEDTANIHYGTNIETFMEFIEDNGGTYYFHNLRFDGEFIISYLFNNGFTHSRERNTKTFDTLISAMGQFYQITVTFKRNGKKKLISATMRDSLKKLPMSVANIAKAFDLDISKGSIDYDKPREIGYVPTRDEIEYITNDILIPAQALQIQFDEGLTKMTVGADALAGYKDIAGGRWEKLFPEVNLAVDSDIRKAYRGGYTYVMPEHQNKVLGTGCVFDVNSLYPSVMYYQPLPVGVPVYFHGKYEPMDGYPLYIQHFTCTVKLKPDHLPTLQIKNNPFYVSTQYIIETPEPVELHLTNVDLDLLLEHYDVDVLYYVGGWAFHSETGFFCEYIDHWNKIKSTSTGGKRSLAKLMLNSLYGKFATNPDITGKTPWMDEDGVVHYRLGEPEYRKPVYTPVGVFVTAWARDKTIRTAQAVYDRFVYADTDSIHLLGCKQPDIDIHPNRLGAWKHEGDFTRAKFVRAKTYMEEIDGKIEVKCAGLPEKLRGAITFENFRSGLQIQGKLMPHHVRGGIVLVETTFTVL